MLGLLLVAVCGVVGARVLASADDYALVWSATRDLPAGATLDAAAVQPHSIRFRDQADADRYLGTEQSLTGAVLTRPLGAGELIPSAAIATTGGEPLDELPLGVAAAAMPAGLRQGDRVDVWVVPIRPDGRSTPASRVLSSVTVVSAGGVQAGLGGAALRTVVVGVEHDDRQLSSVLPALTGGDVVLVRLGA